MVKPGTVTANGEAAQEELIIDCAPQAPVTNKNSMFPAKGAELVKVALNWVPVATNEYQTSKCWLTPPPPWHPAAPVILSLAPTTVPLTHGFPRVKGVAPEHKSLAGWAIETKDNIVKTAIAIFLNRFFFIIFYYLNM